MAQGITDAQFEDLKAIRATYPIHVSPSQIGEINNKLAWKHKDTPGARLGMEGKPGSATTQPRTGIQIWNGIRIIDAAGNHWGEDICGACSAGVYSPQRSTPGSATPTGPKGFVVPVSPEVEPPPPSGDLEARVAALEIRMSALEATAIKDNDEVTMKKT